MTENEHYEGTIDDFNILLGQMQQSAVNIQQGQLERIKAALGKPDELDTLPEGNAEDGNDPTWVAIATQEKHKRILLEMENMRLRLLLNSGLRAVTALLSKEGWEMVERMPDVPDTTRYRALGIACWIAQVENAFRIKPAATGEGESQTRWRKQIAQVIDHNSDRIMDLERFYYGIDNPAEQGIDQRLDALENKVSALIAARSEAETPEGDAELQTPQEDAAEWRDLYTEEHRKLGEAEAALEELREAYDNAQYDMEILAREQVYQGNSVHYWYDKATAYKGCIGKINDILHAAGKQHDDEKNTGDLIKELVAERDEALALVAERDEALALLREGHIAVNAWKSPERWRRTINPPNASDDIHNQAYRIADWLEAVEKSELWG